MKAKLLNLITCNLISHIDNKDLIPDDLNCTQKQFMELLNIAPKVCNKYDHAKITIPFSLTNSFFEWLEFLKELGFKISCTTNNTKSSFFVYISYVSEEHFRSALILIKEYFNNYSAIKNYIFLNSKFKNKISNFEILVYSFYTKERASNKKNKMLKPKKGDVFKTFNFSETFYKTVNCTESKKIVNYLESKNEKKLKQLLKC